MWQIPITTVFSSTIINRSIETGHYRLSQHAIDRIVELEIPLPDVLYALCRGRRNERHDKYDHEFETWNYAIEGKTPDGNKIRIIVSFTDKSMMLIITVIDLA